MTTPGLGIREANLHPSTGLRCETFKTRATYAPAAIVGTGTQLSDQSTWTEITLRRDGLLNQMPVPATPCITFVNNNATPAFGQELRFRAYGYNGFGEAIVEETPLIVIPDPGGSPTQPYTTRIWLSKCFASVTKLEYKAASIDGSNDSISVGHVPVTYIDNTPTATTGQWIAEENYGVQTPMKVLTYDSVNAVGGNSAGEFEILSMQMTRLNEEIYHVNTWAINAGAADAITMVENLSQPLTNEGLFVLGGVRFILHDVGGTGSPAVTYPVLCEGRILTVAPLSIQIDSVVNYTSGSPTGGWVQFVPWTSLMGAYDSRTRVTGAVGTPEHNAGFVIGVSDSALAWEGDTSKFRAKGQIATGAGWSPFIDVKSTKPGNGGVADQFILPYGAGDDIEYSLRVASHQRIPSGSARSGYPDEYVWTR